MRRRRRSHCRTVLAGAVVIAAGFGVALVERYRMPRGSIWLVVGATALVVLVIRLLDRRDE